MYMTKATTAVTKTSAKSITYYIKYYINSINNSKFLAGIVMLLLNVGSKYIEIGLSKTQEQALRNALGREILIFSVVFMGTHDIILSIIMTAAFMVLSGHLFNEKSKYCIISKNLTKIQASIDVNNDEHISKEEEQKALEVLEKAKKQKKRGAQHEFISYLDNNKYSGANLH